MRRAFLVLAFLLHALAPVRAEAPQPYMMIRALLELQTQIVQGKAKARDEQPKMLADIGRQFAATPQELWSDPRNARASIVWLLSGGSPRTMRVILRPGVFSKDDYNLARGALAFAEGRAAQARDLIGGVDARKLDPLLGGQIALVQAALVLSEDIGKSIELLGVARLLAPGSLVEETALRRQISLVGQTSDAANFATLSRQYARRFKASLYAQEFRESFAQTFMRIGSRASDDQLVSLEPILQSFDVDERCRLAILIARESLLEGAWRSAAVFSDLVMKPPVESSCDVPRARLYRAAARATRPEGDADLLALEKLDPARLNAEDRALRKAALAYAQVTRSWPQPREPEERANPASSPEATLLAAAQALETSAALLREKRR